MRANTGHVRGAALSLCRKAEQEVLGSGPCLCGQISASRFWQRLDEAMGTEGQTSAGKLRFRGEELSEQAQMRCADRPRRREYLAATA